MTFPELSAPSLSTPDLRLIYGQQAQSTQEWYTAVALWTFKWHFQYQVPVLGGDQRKGGTKIDFLVETVPSVTALFVDGEYWHRGLQSAIDKIVRLRVKQALEARYGTAPRILEAAGSELYDQDAAKSYIRQHIGRA